MQGHDRSFDVCILCALYEEARALEEVNLGDLVVASAAYHY